MLADTDCDFSVSENVTDSPTALVRITARMGRSGTTTQRARSATSGASTPESTLAETVTPADDKSDQSSPSDQDGQVDARRAGEQVFSLLKGVDQKKLIALLQSGALEDVMSNQVQGEKKLAKVVQECVYPLLPRNVCDMYSQARWQVSSSNGEGMHSPSWMRSMMPRATILTPVTRTGDEGPR